MAWWLAATSRWRTACWNAGPTKPVFCSHFRRHIKAQRGFYLASATALERTPGLPAPLNAIEQRLLDLDLGTGLFHLLLDGFRVGLVDAFLDGLRRAIDEILGLLQAQARHFAHGLDGVDLVLAGGREDHGELGLLLGGGTTGGTTGRGGGDGNGGGGGNAELLFHVLDELRQLEDGHAPDR